MMSKATIRRPESDRLIGLVRRLSEYDGFVRCVDDLRKGRDASLSGVWGASRALVAASLAQNSAGPLVLVAPHPSDVDEVADDLSLFVNSDRVAPASEDSDGTNAGALNGDSSQQTLLQRFPAWESSPGEQVLYDDIYGDRLRLLKSLTQGESPRLIVTSIQSLLQPVPDQATLSSTTRSIAVGQTLDVDSLARWLVENDFHSTSAVELPGEFSLRGGILDVFAPDWFDPVRIEMFGDEVESLRTFEIASQRSRAAIDGVEITVLAPSVADQEHFASYLPEDSWMVLLEPDELEREGKHYLERLERPQEFHSVTQTWKQLARFASATCESIATGSTSSVFHLPIESVERFAGDINKVRDEIDSLAADQEVIVVCETEAEIERLGEVFAPTKLVADERLHFSLGAMSSGFRLIPEKIAVLSGAELFRRSEVVRRTRRRLGRVIDSFLELREGDLVVHLAHGIGRYRGLKLLEKEDHVEEHLELEFHGSTKIYVPASKIELVQKYVGGTKSRPQLARIGGKSWVRQKQAAEQAVTDLAVDMIETQAARAARPGIAFPEDSAWQQEFDAAFPYQETPDQLTGVRAIKADMQLTRPMDRLLCGDVGFGKTELAIRAAFKAVDAGYQVAVLVPTTVLCEQHRRTFAGRMSEFPFEIASLSRFSTAKEQRETIKRINSGSVDIVVGTHRLASADVQFENLGLVIIDEEQRFGVAVKERLKALRAAVDVLTMTATPIPRTLHMSLLGVKSISNLETPPADRTAVETRVTRFSDELIRHAVLRELNRDGQIFFVHNRVKDIHKVAQRLAEIVPEATIEIAHGQMPEKELERVMVRFIERKFDLLLATTIVESGLDIPTANTIFIDEGDRYGLADLHQLRGRVGRYKHRAYCYLLIDEKKHLSPEAARRLRAIEEFSQLGAGFAIAMRDLELRGAGNILGTQQSGHIASVGYELYCSLLETTVRRLKQMPPKEVVDVSLELPGEAHLPGAYVSDMRTKIDLYRRLARVIDPTQLEEFSAELVDRFGPAPPAVERLLSLAELRIFAHARSIRSIHLEPPYVVLGYADRAKIEHLSAESGGLLRVVDGQNAYLPLGKEAPCGEGLILLLKSLLLSDR